MKWYFFVPLTVICYSFDLWIDYLTSGYVQIFSMGVGWGFAAAWEAPSGQRAKTYWNHLLIFPISLSVNLYALYLQYRQSKQKVIWRILE